MQEYDFDSVEEEEEPDESIKARFEEVLAGLIEKPQGKPTLVPESDKRPAMNNAKSDFSEN